ncbi:deoxyribonuclease IV [Anoxybacterium hadale]|uniref:Deoxyribonuclease IV n=1 Tax=Anoxybacterium hadale TaxID=3408580 RepID=A0ACD1AFL6_9FIRM|nr:deoxyribonuclease IV [Clostridiales bacterium]
MLNIGCHLSSAKGFAHMGKEALSIDANTFQFFTRNPRGSKAKAINENDIKALRHIMEENDFAPLLAHAPYTLNPCSADARTKEFALEVLIDDLVRMEHLPGNLYNFHPGSHVGQGTEAGIQLIADALNFILTPSQTTTVLLETMSGKGSEIGGTFQELQRIIEKITLNEKVGICMDTCHVHDAGYDIVNDLDGVLDEFDHTIGLDRLKAIHLNDSKNPISSRKDRHEKIGEGILGLETMVNIINHPKLKALPFYLETPNEVPGYAQEIKLLRSLSR